jgi:hypothetical protein
VLTQIPGTEGARSYQQIGADFLVAPNAPKLLWMATGTGKTWVLLLAWAQLGCPRPALFITKAIGRHVFPRDAIKVIGPDFLPGVLWAGKQYGSGIHEISGRRSYTSIPAALSECPGIVTSFEILRSRFQELTKIPWKLLVIDEMHEIKGGHKPKKKRDGTPYLLRYDFCRTLADITRASGGEVWGATATPIMDRRHDLWAQFDVVYPGALGSRWSFVHKFCGAYFNQWGGLDTTGETNTAELDEIIRPRVYTVTRADVADQMPPVTYDVRLISFDNNKFSHLGGSRETSFDRAADMKRESIMEIVADRLNDSQKVAVITVRRRLAHQYGLDITSKKFGRKLRRHVKETLDCPVITGAVEMNKRIVTTERFNALQTGPAVLAGTMGSLMTSIDLQQTDAVIVAAFPDRPGDLLQFLGRFNRLMGRPVTIIFPIAQRTSDEWYKERILDKAADIVNLNAETQGKGGVFESLQAKDMNDELLDDLRSFLAQINDVED